ncbi:hypothetical protein [Xanthobacter flavus]|uniref:hypothetical protein n=1 Tax=Xanthobacter flavus TaxID=281 RepID=UPI0037276641
MWWFLVLLGVLIALAGLAVIGLGVTIYVSAFGNTLITTGAVAASGGFVITAMGLVLRQLDRLTRQIERSYPAGEAEAEEAAAQPASRSARAGRGAAPRLSVDDLVGSEETDAEAAPPPARERAADRPQERPQERAPERAPERPQERQAERNPAPRRPAGPSPLLPPPEAGQPADPMVEARRQRVQRGPEPAPEAPAAPPAPPRPRTGYEPPPRPARPAPTEAPPPVPAPAPAREPDEPRILKSGIVGGMAYTLYSDGSIQAELPTGVVRFASLQELRDHVAQAQQGER